jgi:hypothetical protein
MQIELTDTRERKSFVYSCEVNKKLGTLDRMLAWCRTELLSDWRWELVGSGDDQWHYIFYFDAERDLFAFTLQWQ